MLAFKDNNFTRQLTFQGGPDAYVPVMATLAFVFQLHRPQSLLVIAGTMEDQVLAQASAGYRCVLPSAATHAELPVAELRRLIGHLEAEGEGLATVHALADGWQRLALPEMDAPLVLEAMNSDGNYVGALRWISAPDWGRFKTIWVDAHGLSAAFGLTYAPTSMNWAYFSYSLGCTLFAEELPRPSTFQKNLGGASLSAWWEVNRAFREAVEMELFELGWRLR